MKTTPFTDVHIALGAKMHEFAGFNMPIEYTGIIDEHMTVVNGVGVFDVSHMGEFWVKGPNALAFIQSVTSNDASVLPIGKAQYTCFPNDKGGIVDDLLVYHYEPEKYLLVVNAGNIAKDWDWCVSHNTVGAELENSSDRTAQLAVQGPKAVEVLQRLTPVDLSSIPYYSFVTGEFAGCKNVIISNTGYTGAGGFELYFYPDDAMTIWNAIFEAGKPEGIKPIGLGARDTLRLEMGFCLYGNDLDDTTSPIEAGLGWITKFAEGKNIKPIGLGARDTLRLEMGFCLYGNDLDDTTSPIEAGLGWITKFAEGKNFTNRAELERQKKEGVSRKLCAFELVDKGIPRHGYEIADAEDNIIGVVTSGTMSPVLKKGIGMGYVKPEFAKAGTEICIKVRGRNLKAQVVKAPFRK